MPNAFHLLGNRLLLNGITGACSGFSAESLEGDARPGALLNSFVPDNRVGMLPEGASRISEFVFLREVTLVFSVLFLQILLLDFGFFEFFEFIYHH